MYDWFDSFSIIKEISFTVMTSFSNFFDTAVKKPTIFSKTSCFNDSFGISGIAVPCKAKIWQNFEIFLTFQSKNDVRRAVPLITKKHVKFCSINVLFCPINVLFCPINVLDVKLRLWNNISTFVWLRFVFGIFRKTFD